MRSPYLEDLEEIGAAYEIREGKQKVKVDRAYQCGIAVYQLAKLWMLKVYYDFLDKYVERRDFEYCYMDTDSAYFAISGEELRDVVRPEMLDEYDKDVANWQVTDEYSARAGGLFKPEFIGFKGVFLTAKCFVEGKSGTKFSCKGMSKKQNEMTWQFSRLPYLEKFSFLTKKFKRLTEPRKFSHPLSAISLNNILLAYQP